jgi:hypothetical protein
LETFQVKKGPARLKLNEEIDIALFVGFAPSHGAEDTHIAGAVLGTHAQDLLPFRAQDYGDAVEMVLSRTTKVML